MKIIVANDGPDFARVEVQDRSPRGTFTASSEEVVPPGEFRVFNVSKRRTIQVLLNEEAK